MFSIDLYFLLWVPVMAEWLGVPVLVGHFRLADLVLVCVSASGGCVHYFVRLSRVLCGCCFDEYCVGIFGCCCWPDSCDVCGFWTVAVCCVWVFLVLIGFPVAWSAVMILLWCVYRFGLLAVRDWIRFVSIVDGYLDLGISLIMNWF
jgi:hypothetical protein